MGPWFLGNVWGGSGAAPDPPPFSPLDLAPALWLKDDVGKFQERTGAAATTPASADADPIGTWQDQSGNARHLTASTDAKRAVNKLNIQNGRSVARGDGVDDTLVTAAPVSTAVDNFTIFLVVNPTSVAGSVPVSNGASSDGYSYGLAGNRNIYLSGVAAQADGVAPTSWEVVCFRRTAGTMTLRTNGVDRSLGSATSTPLTPTTGTAIFSRITDQFMPGDIREVLVYPTALADGDVLLVESYLNNGIY